MCRTLLVTLLALLAGTGVARAQPEPDPPALETLPYPAQLRGMPSQVAQPPVVSTSIYPDVGPPAAGMLGFDADVVLWFAPTHRNGTIIDSPNLSGALVPGSSDTLDDERISRHMVPGLRVALGYWWMEDNPWTPTGKLPLFGVETRFMFVSQRSAAADNNTSSTIVRPFFDINDAKFADVIVAAPGLATGGISTRAAQSVWGGEANYWRNLFYEWPGTTCSIDGMIGVRYLNVDDSWQLGRDTQFAAVIPPAFLPAFGPFAGNHITEQESFTAHNRFVGGQVGVRGNLLFDKFILSGMFQLAVGVTNEELNIQGTQLRRLPSGATIVSPGALFALPSNIGQHYHNEFTQVPELGAKLAVPINDNLTLALTFTTMYWSRIARATDQIDPAIDITQIPSFPGGAAAAPAGRSHPAVQFNQSDLWLMGFMLSAEFRW
jgi:hypothetical protein